MLHRSVDSAVRKSTKHLLDSSLICLNRTLDSKICYFFCYNKSPSCFSSFRGKFKTQINNVLIKDTIECNRMEKPFLYSCRQCATEYSNRNLPDLFITLSIRYKPYFSECFFAFRGLKGI